MLSENLVKIGYPSLEVTKGASSENVFNVKKKHLNMSSPIEPTSRPALFVYDRPRSGHNSSYPYTVRVHMGP